MLAAPSLIHASAACLSSDTNSHKGMKTLPIRVGLGTSEFVQGASARRTRADGALRSADDGQIFHGRRETLPMVVGAPLVVDRRAKADFCADCHLLHRAV